MLHRDADQELWLRKSLPDSSDIWGADQTLWLRRGMIGPRSSRGASWSYHGPATGSYQASRLCIGACTCHVVARRQKGSSFPRITGVNNAPLFFMMKLSNKRNIFAGNGYISSEELKFILTELDVGDKLSEEEIEGMLLHADSNGDGQIDYKGELTETTFAG